LPTSKITGTCFLPCVMYNSPVNIFPERAA
jgi:hypothetical protein